MVSVLPADGRTMWGMRETFFPMHPQGVFSMHQQLHIPTASPEARSSLSSRIQPLGKISTIPPTFHTHEYFIWQVGGVIKCGPKKA